MGQRRTARPDADIERAYRKERAHRGGMARAKEGDRSPARSSGTPILPQAATHCSPPSCFACCEWCGARHIKRRRARVPKM